MIFLSFILIISLLMISAYLSGNTGYFINADSLLVNLLGIIFSALGMFYGRYRLLLKGLGEIFSFRVGREKDSEIKNLFGGLTLSTIVIGICSTIQGVFSGVFSGLNWPMVKIISVAMFTTVYGILIAVFLFFPVYIKNR